MFIGGEGEGGRNFVAILCQPGAHSAVTALGGFDVIVRMLGVNESEHYEWVKSKAGR